MLVGQSLLTHLLNSNLKVNSETETNLLTVLVTDELMTRFGTWLAESKKPSIVDIIHEVNDIASADKSGIGRLLHQ